MPQPMHPPMLPPMMTRSSLCRTSLVLAAAAALVAAPGASAQTLPTGTGDFQKYGTTGFAILELPLSLRASGRGDTRALGVDGADAAFVNPAGLGFTDARTTGVTVGSTRYLGDTQLSSTAISHNFGNFGALAVSVAYLDYGTIERTSNSGASADGTFTRDGTFSANALVGGLSYARQMTDRFSFGATAKYVRESIDVYDASAVVFDLGLSFRTPLTGLRIGGTVQNFGREAKYIGNTFKMPSSVRLGASYDALPPSSRIGQLTTQAEFHHPNNGPEEFRMAAEYLPVQAVTIRAGYGLKVGSTGVTALSSEGLSLGASFDGLGERVGLDVAYTSFGDLKSTVGVALRARL